MVKKIVTIFFLLLLFTNNSFSQKFELGLKVGPSFATQKLSTIQSIESVSGIHFGGFIYVKLPIVFGIQTGAYYSQQGSEFSIKNLIESNSLDYVNIPILIRNDFGPFNFHFGPQFGFLTNAFDSFKNNIKNQFKSRDFSLVVGIGLRLPARFGLSVRYIRGLKNISDPNILNYETKNTMFQFSIKYSLIQLGIKKNKKEE